MHLLDTGYEPCGKHRSTVWLRFHQPRELHNAFKYLGSDFYHLEMQVDFRCGAEVDPF
jgi:hypothetical protein